MGLCCSVDEQQQMEQFDCLQQHNQQRRSADHNLRPNSPYGVGMGIAMMMQQAAALAKVPPGMDILTLEAEIRKAKAEGRTVTIANGCIYFDYQLIGCIPPDTTFHA
uniref:Prohibitin n=1 Tax=Loa loa TaxID=7209 RepID=A0A1I7VFG5_LOALO